MASAHIFPQCRIWPNCGAMSDVPWTEWTGTNVLGTSDAHLGPDGVSASMVIIIPWAYLQEAVQAILGYSFRSSPISLSLNPSLSRRIPWQFPYWNQLYARAITKIQGIRMEGDNITNPEDFFAVAGILGGVGSGQAVINFGPWTEYAFAAITIQFWRPPYYIRTDADIFSSSLGRQQEWLRYVDKDWSISTQMLVREDATATFVIGQDSLGGGYFTNEIPFQGKVGQKVMHSKVKRTWYEIPEQCIFAPAEESLPTGLPLNLMFMQTKVYNPISGYLQDPTTPPFDYGLARNFQYPLPGCVNAPIQRGGIVLDDTLPSNRIFGCYMGTLLLEAVEITPRPLQLPAFLMQIPPAPFGSNEGLSQQQYDITFYFDLFDPPRSPAVAKNMGVISTGLAPIYQAVRGHNLGPFSGDFLWYATTCQLPASGSATESTIFQYADFTDLFRVL